MPKSQKTVSDLSQEITDLVAKCEEMRARLGDTEARLKVLEVALPVELRKLSAETVAAAIEQDPFARFEVLVNWETSHMTLRAGTILRADHVRYLVDYVKAGLFLGEPTDQKAVVERMKAEADARTRAAIEATRLAKVAAERAEAIVHADQAEAIASGETLQ